MSSHGEGRTLDQHAAVKKGTWPPTAILIIKPSSPHALPSSHSLVVVLWLHHVFAIHIRPFITLSPSDVTLPCSVRVNRAKGCCLSCQLRLGTPFSGLTHELTHHSRRVTSAGDYIMHNLNLVLPSPNTVTSLPLLSSGAALPR